MGHRINTDSILALDKRIEEMTAELTQLKRSRNSLLNSARISPEILGHIFCLSAIPGAADSHFSGLRKDSYNFLLVCHHWSEAARRTPELWGFWSNRFEDWKRQHRRPGTSPFDLVLDEANREVGSFDEALQEALRKYAGRDAIRKVHLRGEDIKLLTTIVSTLTPEDDGARDSGIESIVLNGLGGAFCSLRESDPGVTVVPSFGVDASDFFSRYRFRKLRTLPFGVFQYLVLGLGLPEITRHGARQPFTLEHAIIHVTNTFTPRLESESPDPGAGVAEGQGKPQKWLQTPRASASIGEVRFERRTQSCLPDPPPTGAHWG